MEEQAEVPMLAVPRTRAEEVRRRLRDDGALLPGASPIPQGEVVWLPLTEEAAAAVAEGALMLEGTIERRTTRLHRQQGGFRDLLTDLPVALQEELPSSYDLLGGIALIKVPPALWPLRDRIGEALHRQHPALTAVFHDEGVQGPMRVRAITPIWGDGKSTTAVAEHGATLQIDVAKAYFSPRLATERQAVAQLLATVRGTILDLTCGVAPTLVAIANASVVPKHLIGVDLNADAIALARVNLSSAAPPSAYTHVSWELHQGDSTHLMDSFARPRALLSNHPTSAAPLLSAALRRFCQASADVPLDIFAYHLAPKDAPPGLWLQAILEEGGFEPARAQWRQLHAYSPSMCLWALRLTFGAVAHQEKEPGRP